MCNDFVKVKCGAFAQFVSLDTWVPSTEYIRHGLDFDVAINRCEEFIRDIPIEVVPHLSITMNNPSIIHYKNY